MLLKNANDVSGKSANIFFKSEEKKEDQNVERGKFLQPKAVWMQSRKDNVPVHNKGIGGFRRVSIATLC